MTTRAMPAIPRTGVEPFAGHPGRVRAVTFTPGGDELLSGGDDGTVCRWDITGGRRRRSWPAHAGGVSAIAVVGDGTVLATTGADARLRLWDRRTGSALPAPRLDQVGAVAGVPGHQLLAVASLGSVRVVDLDTGDQVGSFATPGGVRLMTMGSTGTTVAWTGDDGTVVAWDLTTGTSTRVATHRGGVSALALDGADEWLVTADADRAVRLWHLDTGTETRALGAHRAVVRALAITPDRRRVISAGEDGAIHATTVTDGSVTVVGGHPGGVYALALSPDGAVVASAGGDRTVRLWDRGARAARPPLRGHAGGVRALSISRDGHRVVSGGDDRRVRVWDLSSGVAAGRALVGGAGAVRSLGTRPDDVTVVASGHDGVIWSWDPTTGRERSVSTGHHGDVSAAATDALGRIVAMAGTDGSLDVWDTRNGARLATMRGHHGRIGAVAVGADGRFVVTGGSDGTVRVWEAGTGRERRVLTGPLGAVGALAVLPDGTAVVVGDDRGALHVWPLDVPARTTTSGPRAPQGPLLLGHHGPTVTALAVTPAGDRVVSGSEDGSVLVWERARPAPPRTLTGHTAAVRALAVTADGRRIVSGGDDGGIRVWDGERGTQTAGTDLDAPAPAPPPAVTGDDESPVDHLGAPDDVRVLAALLADRTTRPPLSLALVGPPGSGKSSALRQLHDRIARLAELSRHNPGRSTACASVRQLRVDASRDGRWVEVAGRLADLLAEAGPEDGTGRPEGDGTGTAGAEARRELATLRHQRDRLDRELAEGPRDGALAAVPLLALLVRPAGGDHRRRRRRRRLTAALAVVAAVLALAAWAGRGSPAGTLAAIAAVAVTAIPALAGAARAWRGVDKVPGSLRDTTARHRRELDRRVREADAHLDRLDAARRLAGLAAAAGDAGDPPPGLLGQAARDLEGLATELAAARAAWEQAGSQGPPPLERIVVHVDHLDRCPPAEGLARAESLAALLASPLFVTVAAVDPAWLRRAVAGNDPRPGPGGPADRHDPAEPAAADHPGGVGLGDRDRLDRLFPLVVGLRPLGEGAAGLIGTLTPPAPTRRPGAAAPAEASPDPDPGIDPGPGPVPAPDGPHATSPPALDPPPDRRHLDEAERRLLTRLLPALRTPRQVKAVVNLYQLVRAGVADQDLDRFVGTGGAAPHQAVLVLLALTVAAPGAARRLYLALAERGDAGCRPGRGERGAGAADDVVGLLRALAATGGPGADALAGLAELLDGARAELGLGDGLDDYRAWAGTIARFSVDTCDLVAPPRAR